ncbi:coiled-coil domain-containing protein 191 [Pelodytes ibericus]
MLTGAGEMTQTGLGKPELYRWKRSSKKPSSKPVFDYDNVEHWIKRVEQASEFAVSEVFSVKKTAPRGKKPARPTLDLATVDQLHDHDEAFTEAQDLLSEWMSTKLKLELASEDEDEVSNVQAERSPPQQPMPEFVKYDRFDDLYAYLEQEAESTKAQDFLQQLLQKQVVDSGILERLRSDSNSPVKKPRDPRLTIELRHQQVKENRARRQKELEQQKQDRALKKAAMSQAQALVQEEAKQKTLKVKKEEEEIQREMVKLRKDMMDRRKAMDEARRIEWKRKELENSWKPQGTVGSQRDIQTEEGERRKLEKQARIQERLSQLYAENHKCLQKYFSSWYKLVLERRVKMGKARALADWKQKLQTFRAWRDHVRSRKLERETHEMEMDLRDQNRKQQLALGSYRKRLLRRSLLDWQLWCRAEKGKRELEVRKEDTKRKMAALLDAASLLKVSKETSPDQRDGMVGSPANRGLQGSRAVDKVAKTPVALNEATPGQPPSILRHAWQVTRKHAQLTPEELQASKTSPRLQLHPQRRASSHGEVFENRHMFQQQLIEEQRRQLEEQKEMILGLMENQKLIRSRQEAERATAATAQLSDHGTHAYRTLRRESDHGTATNCAGAKSRHGHLRNVPRSPWTLTECSAVAMDTHGKFHSRHEHSRKVPQSPWFLQSVHPEDPVTSPSPSVVSTARPPAHPAVRAMEERAAQRRERKRELEERKRKQEEEKLAQLKAMEAERLQREAAEREAELERRREEKRIHKQKELERQVRQVQEKEQLEKARGHYHRMLLRFWGLRPWMKLAAESRLAMQRAERHHNAAVMRGSLLAWRQAVTDILADKISRADGLWKWIVLRRGFRHWVKCKDYIFILEERADRHHRALLRRKTFLAWMDLAQEEKMTLWEKQRVAAEHNQRRMLLTAFRTWRKFPKFLRDQKLREERREQLRKKVTEILPDFKL